jgi:Spy/CpxP family protein refolding chaperone
MKKQSKWITGIAVAALSGSLAFAAVNHDGNGNGKWRGHEGQGRQEQMAQALNLTPEQKQQWADAQKAFFETNKAALQQNRQLMQDFRAAKQANDQAKIDALKPQVEAARAQMKSLRDAQNVKLMSILNDQQKAQFQQMLDQRAQREHHRD